MRVRSAGVEIDGAVTAQIGAGLLVLLGAATEDSAEDIAYVVDKTVNLRIFEDDEGKMNRSLSDVGGELLIVSQFTLMGDARKGRRPSFIRAGRPEEAKKLYEAAVEKFRQTGISVKTGEFQADMQVSSVNDGPVTILIDSSRLF